MMWSPQEMEERKVRLRTFLESAGLTPQVQAIQNFMQSSEADLIEDSFYDESFTILDTPKQRRRVALRMTPSREFSFIFESIRTFDDVASVAQKLSKDAGADCWKIYTCNQRGEELHMLHNEHECPQTRDSCSVRSAFYSTPAIFKALLDQGAIVKLEYGSSPFSFAQCTGTTLHESSWGCYDMTTEATRAEWSVLYHMWLCTV